MSEIKRQRGRPSSDKNNKVVTRNNNDIKSDIPEEENIVNTNSLGDNNNNSDVVENNVINNTDDDSDLKQYISEKKSNPDSIKKENNSSSSMFGGTDDIVDELNKELEDFERKQGLSQSHVEDIEQKFSPLQEPVKKRGYTDGSMGVDNHNTSNNNNDIPDANNVGNNINTEKVISEPNYSGFGQSKRPEVDETLLNPTNPSNSGIEDAVLDPENNNGGNGGGGHNNNPPKNPSGNTNNTGGSGNNNSGGNNNPPKNTSGGASSDNNNNNSTGSSSDKVQKESNLKDMSPKEKRKATEKTAEAILLGYKQFVPLPFIYIATFNEKKLKKLHDNGEIDLDKVITPNGDTTIGYVKEFNSKVEETFKVSDDEIEMLREPLIDVLMEEEIAMTPKQTLGFTIAQIIVGKVMMCAKLVMEKNSDMDEFKRMHQQSLEKQDIIDRNIQEQNELLRRQNAQFQQQQQQYQPQNQQPQQQYQQPTQQQQYQNNNNVDSSNISIVNDDKEDKSFINKNKDTSDGDDAKNVAMNDISKDENVNFNDVKDFTPSLDDALNADLDITDENNNIDVKENNNKTESKNNNNNNDIPD